MTRRGRPQTPTGQEVTADAVIWLLGHFGREEVTFSLSSQAFPSPPLQSQLLILTLGGRDKSSQDVSDHVWSAAKTAVTGSSPPLFFSQKTCEHRARHGRKEK